MLKNEPENLTLLSEEKYFFEIFRFRKFLKPKRQPKSSFFVRGRMKWAGVIIQKLCNWHFPFLGKGEVSF